MPLPTFRGRFRGFNTLSLVSTGLLQLAHAPRLGMDRTSGSSVAGAAGLRAYYVAVGSADAKLDTLVELLEALRADARLAVAVACSSRDSLDAVAAALAHSGGFNIAILHSDMELHDMEQQVVQLKRALQSLPQLSEGFHQQQSQHQPQQLAAQQPQHQQVPSVAAKQQQDPRSIALVMTDVCLQVLHKDILPLGPSLLIQYDLPSTKEVLQRRLGCVFGSSKERSRRGGRLVVIDFVVAGQLAAFRSRERMTSLAVQEMPVHVPDIFV